MEYINKYAIMIMGEFKKLILMGRTKSRNELVFFIFNTLHNIVDSRSYCYCDEKKMENVKNVKFASFL